MKRFVVAVACYSSLCAFAGPFGMSKGMTLEELKKQGTFSSSEAFEYKATTIKNGHPDFEIYFVTLTPEQGLCRIRAGSKDIKTSAFGNELQGKYRELVGVLSQKYGEPGHNFDLLREGSIWKESQYWMMSLLKKERTLSTYWTKLENKNLSDSLGGIGLAADALSGNKGFIRLDYEFDNFDTCTEFIKSKKNSNL